MDQENLLSFCAEDQIGIIYVCNQPLLSYLDRFSSPSRFFRFYYSLLSSPSLFIQGGRIALHKAARFGQTSVTRYLVELGVNVNATDDVSQ